MNEITTAVDWAAKLGPSGILAVGLFVLWKKQQAIELAYQTLQEKRVAEAQAYASEKRNDSKENAQALLAVADRTTQAIERLEALAERR